MINAIGPSQNPFRHGRKKARTAVETPAASPELIRDLQNRGKYEAALTTGLTALEQLGIRIPLFPDKTRLDLKIMDTRKALRHFCPENHAARGPITDVRLNTIMDILASIVSPAMACNRDCASRIILTMLDITLHQGRTKYSPLIYAALGAILAGYAEDYTAADVCSRLALSRVGGSNDKNLFCQAVFLYAENVNHWVRHARTGLALYRDVHESALECGNRAIAEQAAAHRLILPVIAGEKIPRISETIKNISTRTRKTGALDPLLMCTLSSRYVSALEGATADICDLSGRDFNEPSFAETIQSTGSRRLVFAFYCTVKTQLFFLAGQYEKALVWAGRTDDIASEIKGLVLFPEPLFYRALSMARIYPEASRARKTRILRRMESIADRFRIWAARCRENFSHKQMLIRAEIARITGKKDIAAKLFQHSIQSAIDNGYTQNAAIANECAALFYRETRNPETAHMFLANAHFGYLKWGAAAKADRLAADFPVLAPPSGTGCTESSWEIPPPGTRFQDFLDWRAMLQTFRRISRETDRPSLIQTIMKSVMENAGARRCVLLINRGGTLFVEAEIRLEWKQALVTPPILLSQYGLLPAEMVKYTARNGKTRIIGDARREHMFSKDPYFRDRKKQSIVCAPVLYQEELKGVLFLENNAAPSVFSKDRVFAIDMLSAQAAVALENAALYARLKESENRYRSIFENALEGIFQINRQGIFIRVNRSLASLLGHESPASVIESKISVNELFFFEPGRKTPFFRQLAQSGQIRNYEGAGRRKDGGRFRAIVSARAVFNELGKIAYYEGSVIDISAQRQREEAERQKQTAEAAARAKSIFLANMSHEIRTPLNAIIALSRRATGENTGGKHREIARKIHRNASSLLSTVDGILDFSKLEADCMVLETIDFTISGIIEKTRSMFFQQAAEKGLRLEFHISGNIPPVLRGDPFKLDQVLTNLAGNAIKFTEKGRVRIGVKCAARAGNTLRLRFVVSDTGPGICITDISRLFKSFSQADNAVSRLYGGTGLGLAISKGLVELMNGRIWARNNPGRGAVFFFEIDTGFRDAPADENSKTKNKKPEPASAFAGSDAFPLSGMRVLFVEDNDASREITAEILEESGCLVDTAASGRKAVEMAKQRRYDAVLMDIQMPGMDGLEAARLIRSAPGNRSLPVVAMTAGTMEAHPGQGSGAEMADTIRKPFEAGRLCEALYRCRNNPGRSAKTGAKT